MSTDYLRNSLKSGSVPGDVNLAYDPIPANLRQPRTGRPAKRTVDIPHEFWLSTILVIFVPGSMSGPFGPLGSYICLGVAILMSIGILRLKPSVSELTNSFPMTLLIIAVCSTLTAYLIGRFDAETLRGTPAQFLAFLLTICLVRLWCRRGGALRKWMLRVAMISIVVSSVAIVEYLTRRYLEIDFLYSALTGITLDDSLFRRAAGSFRANSTFGNPLVLGMFAAIAGSACLAFYLDKFKLGYLAMYLVNVAAAISSMSRSSWLALGAGSGLVILQRVVSRRQASSRAYLHYLIIPLLMGLLLINADIRDQIWDVSLDVFNMANDRIFETETISYTYRASAASAAFGDMLSYPTGLLLGYGLGAENHFFLSDDRMTLGMLAVDPRLFRTFDNTVITIAYSFGLFGLLWLIWMIKTAFLARKSSDQVGTSWYAAALTACLCCIFFFNAFGSPLANFFLASLLGFAPIRRINRMQVRVMPPLTRKVPSSGSF